MKKLSLLILIIAISEANIFAQNHLPMHPRMSPNERAKEITDKMNVAVQLSADQYQKALSTTTDYMIQRDALRKASTQPGEDVREKMRQLNKEHHDKLKAILTALQWGTWEQSRKQEHLVGGANEDNKPAPR